MDAVRSRAYWQRLVDLGPGVGTVYAVALDHVNCSIRATMPIP